MMWQGRFIRVLGISILLAVSGLVAAASAAPQATSRVTPSARAWYSGGLKRSPFFKGACRGALVTSEMGQTFACRYFPEIYYAHFDAAPTIA